MNDINHLILSTTTDYSTDLICIELEKRGLKYLRLNRDHFPEYEINYTLQGDTLKIKMGDTWYELSVQHVDSVYFRAPVFYRTTGKAYSLEEQLKRSQWSSFIRNMIVFDKAQWINYPPSVYQSENKLYQLKIARECGMVVPETYVGNVLPNNIIPEKMYIVKSLDTALFYSNGNTIRNNFLFTSYECIRNSLICLFVILLLTAAPLSFQSEGKNDSLSKSTQVYSFMYSSDAVDYIKKSNVQNDVENSILKVIEKGETNGLPQTFGIVEEHSKLFIKCNVIGETVEIILIEPYTDINT